MQPGYASSNLSAFLVFIIRKFVASEILFFDGDLTHLFNFLFNVGTRVYQATACVATLVILKINVKGYYRLEDIDYFGVLAPRRYPVKKRNAIRGNYKKFPALFQKSYSVFPFFDYCTAVVA